MIENEQAAAAAKRRCKAILTSRHAEGREALAQSLAFDSNLTAEQAIVALQKAGVNRQSSPLAQRVPAGLGMLGTASPGTSSSWDEVIAKAWADRKAAKARAPAYLVRGN